MPEELQKPADPMRERSQKFVNQLIEKTKLGKIPWTTAFEDGQFKALLPGGDLAFVVQVKGDVRRFSMLDENQEYILHEEIDPGPVPPSVRWVGESDRQEKYLYVSIGELQDLARREASQFDRKLTQAEKLLAAI